jgi:hypothetical protein
MVLGKKPHFCRNFYHIYSWIREWACTRAVRTCVSFLFVNSQLHSLRHLVRAQAIREAGNQPMIRWVRAQATKSIRPPQSAAFSPHLADHRQAAAPQAEEAASKLSRIARYCTGLPDDRGRPSKWSLRFHIRLQLDQGRVSASSAKRSHAARDCFSTGQRLLWGARPCSIGRGRPAGMGRTRRLRQLWRRSGRSA